MRPETQRLIPGIPLICMAAYLSINRDISILWSAALKADNLFQINNKITRQQVLKLDMFF